MKKLATALGIMGALLLASNLGLTIVSYSVMLCSSAIFIAQFWNSEREVVVLNAAFGAINIFGIIAA